MPPACCCSLAATYRGEVGGQQEGLPPITTPAEPQLFGVQPLPTLSDGPWFPLLAPGSPAGRRVAGEERSLTDGMTA